MNRARRYLASRRLKAEALEQREMLAGDLNGRFAEFENARIGDDVSVSAAMNLDNGLSEHVNAKRRDQTRIQASLSAGESLEDLTSLVQLVHNGSGLPALSGAIIDGDGMRAVGVAGVRVSGEADPVQTDELWHLGSNTKAMTATLYATFVRDGELSFDDRMADLFPNLDVHPGFADVTPRQLLTHRGGAPSAVYPAQWSDWWNGGDVQTLRAEWAEVM